MKLFFRLNICEKKKKTLYTIYATRSLSIPYVQIVDVYQRTGHINWTFPGPMFMGDGKQRDNQRNRYAMSPYFHVPLIPAS